MLDKIQKPKILSMQNESFSFHSLCAPNSLLITKDTQSTTGEMSICFHFDHAKKRGEKTVFSSV